MATTTRSRRTPSGRRLVIVESPAKAKTIAGYLGDGWVVESSIGHVRDLPRNASDVPAAVKKEPWARLGVNVDEGFSPLYVVSADKKAQVAKLKALLKDCDELFLATDEDREGEAIAWHLQELLDPKVPVRRMVFHEITPSAIAAAVEQPREIDQHLVDAQETRRILDRLYGYEVSPVLWRKVLPRLSAGRVQSVATRILVDRERERMRFVAASWWDLTGTFSTGRSLAGEPATVDAQLATVDGRKVASGSDFADDGSQKNDAAALRLDETAARGLAAALTGSRFTVSAVDERPYRRSPSAPFMTSTLQQEAARKLRLSAATTMRLAQRLYENGHITYMRTDSTTLSQTALDAARSQARDLYGAESVPQQPRRYERKVKNAQEAHEAIRPSGDSFARPRDLAGVLGRDELRLYELIWQRTIASQMEDARGQQVRLSLAGTASDGREAVFTATGTTITFPGFMSAYVEDSDDADSLDEQKSPRLPVLAVGDVVNLDEVSVDGHETKPPARYTEASLVKALEELGVGRPSTYASIISTIQDRGYAFKRGSALVPSWTAFAVTNLMEQYFGRLVDLQFTADVENDLDEIASGERERLDWLSRFYFGSDRGKEGGIARSGGLKSLIESRLEEIDAREINSIPIADGIVLRVGQYGPYLQRGEERVSVPDSLPPADLTPALAAELLDAPPERVLGIDPSAGEHIVTRNGRYGPYVAALPEPEAKKPTRTASLFSSMSLETVTLDQALALLSLPRVVGTAPDGEEITAQNGRYGPYVKKGSESRSLPTEESIFTVTVDEALGYLAAPRTRRGQKVTGPLKELGPDPESGRPISVRDGRFGMYVTDGETNATIRDNEDLDQLTLERALELLADRRSREPRTAPARRSSSRAPRGPAPTTARTVRKGSSRKKAGG